MEFRADDPGAVQFGNFINYYKFNSASERIELLPKHVWLPENENSDVENVDNSQPYLLLDVGCNSGVLTHHLWQFLTANLSGRRVHVLGIDIDPTLIERAQANDPNDDITYATCDVMDEIAFNKVTNYLKLHNRHRFDAVCCFSITMWIHLNHNDIGLQKFLQRLANVAELLIVEPQPWKCYQTAERRLKKTGETFPLFLALNWRSDVESKIRSYLGQELALREVHECDRTKWKRTILFYRRR